MVKFKLGLYIFFSIVGLLILIMAVTDLISAFSASTQFVFGTEVGGWKYNSKTNFLIFNSIQIFISLALLIGLLRLVFRLKNSEQ